MKYRTFDSSVDTRQIMLVTDLDGTLLDFEDYSFDAAEPILRRLRKLRVPVICCSSKTSREIVYWRRRLRLTDPFISENGSALFLPVGKFGRTGTNLTRRGSYLVQELGAPRNVLRSVLEEVRQQSRIPITGFSDMHPRIVKSLCGFKTIQQAKIAADREYSEPFVFPPDTDSETVNRVILRFENHGLKVIRGKRFFHLVGRVDKGVAIRALQEKYIEIGQRRTITIGIGDSRNDLEMLRSVDIPILVMGKNRRYDRFVKESAAPLLAGAPGPRGWSLAVEKLLKESV